MKRLLLSNNRMVTLAEARTEKSDDPAGAGGGAQRGAGRGKSARRAAALLSPNGAASPLEDRHSPPFLPALAADLAKVLDEGEGTYVPPH